MCLVKFSNAKRSGVPLKKSRIRYKVLRYWPAADCMASFMYPHVWSTGIQYQSSDTCLETLRSDRWNEGFHVFACKGDAERYASWYPSGSAFVAQVRVHEHIASGIMNSGHMDHTETWRLCTLLKVYNDPRKNK